MNQSSRQTKALQRLLKDLKEIEENSLINVAAQPLEDDMFTWHVNISGTTQPLSEGIFHLIIQFKETYPIDAPSIDLCTFVPHANVFPNKYGKKNHICLDMLEDGEFANDSSKNREYTGWSSSYSVLSLLTQLQAFLTQENLYYQSKGSIEDAIQRANQFQCSGCSHKPGSPWPPFQVNKTKQRKLLRRPQVIAIPKTKSVKPSPTNVLPEKKVNQIEIKATLPIQEGKLTLIQNPKKEEKWITIKSKRKHSTTVQDPIKENIIPLDKPITPKEQPENPQNPKKLKNYKRNLSRTKKRKQKNSLTQDSPSKEIKNLDQEKPFQIVAHQSKPKKEISVESTNKIELVFAEKETIDYSRLPAFGDFALLPYEILMEIFVYLSPKDLSSLACTCRNMRHIAEDGYLWKELFSKYYPSSQLCVENVKDWKWLFMVEVNNILSDLVCFHTKLTFEEDVLGIPIQYTVNPKTSDIDYIYSSMDLLSSQAFFQDKVRKTIWKEPFTHWLPLFITKDHFKRGLPFLRKTIVQLSPTWNSSSFDPMMALEVIGKIMNTHCVLLMDKGIHASTKALDGYFALHRLLLALVEEYPSLQKIVNHRLITFIQDPKSRSKSETPNLGNFIIFLSISDKIRWNQFALPYLEENFIRNVIWICREYPGMASNLTPGKGPDYDRLDKSFKAVKVSLRLLMFHIYFLTQIGRPKGVTLEEVAISYDRYYGRPSHQMRNSFQEQVKKILEVDSWLQFFKMIGMKCPSPSYLTDWLKRSVQDSKRKGYHNDYTNFSAIQKSGISKILLKGESYSAPPTLRHVFLEEIWGYPDGIIFLDASCLIFEGNAHVGTVDYRHTNYRDTIQHSGDVIDYGKKSGTHTIKIDLKLLPTQVTALYFTITAWTTTLKDIKQPYIRFTDSDLNQELCRYDLESKDTQLKTSVVMCKLFRESSKSNWKVLAIGHVGFGRADNYAPILDDIKNLHL